MILEMTARQHKAEVGKCAHEVNCGDLVMLEKENRSQYCSTLKHFSGVPRCHKVL